MVHYKVIRAFNFKFVGILGEGDRVSEQNFTVIGHLGDD